MEKLKHVFKPKLFKFFILILLVPFTNLLPLSAGSDEILDVGKYRKYIQKEILLKKKEMTIQPVFTL